MKVPVTENPAVRLGVAGKARPLPHDTSTRHVVLHGEWEVKSRMAGIGIEHSCTGEYTLYSHFHPGSVVLQVLGKLHNSGASSRLSLRPC